jgi:hypothetical protein
MTGIAYRSFIPSAPCCGGWHGRSQGEHTSTFYQVSSIHVSKCLRQKYLAGIFVASMHLFVSYIPKEY